MILKILLAILLLAAETSLGCNFHKNDQHSSTPKTSFVNEESVAIRCPLKHNAARTLERQMQIHVLPKTIPFSVKMSLNTNNFYCISWFIPCEASYSLESNKLKIQKDKWSTFSVKSHNDLGNWRVIFSNDVANETFISCFFFIFIRFNVYK